MLYPNITYQYFNNMIRNDIYTIIQLIFPDGCKCKGVSHDFSVRKLPWSSTPEDVAAATRFVIVVLSSFESTGNRSGRHRVQQKSVENNQLQQNKQLKTGIETINWKHTPGIGG